MISTRIFTDKLYNLKISDAVLIRLKMNTIRRGLKRKEPEGGEDYQAGLTQFQVVNLFSSFFYGYVLYLYLIVMAVFADSECFN